MRRKKQKPEEVARNSNFSRRDFLKGASAAVSSGLLITEAQAAAPKSPGSEAVTRGDYPEDQRKVSQGESGTACHAARCPAG